MYQQNNIERLFDITVKKALPYLILSPPDFRNKLAEQIDSLFHFFQGGDSSITTFIECNEGILGILKDAKIDFDSTTNRRIDAFDSRYKSFDERIRELDERIIKLEKERREIKKANKKISVVEISSAVGISSVVEKSPAVESLSSGLLIVGNTELQHVDKEPGKIIESPPLSINAVLTCPSCGKNLVHKSLKKGDGYYCFKSDKGCGKHYTMGANGVLVESKKEEFPFYICQCGLKLNAQGKKEFDGVLYQIYCCKSPAQGGCGKGYIMDKDGDLHLGKGQIALSRPKILKQDIQSGALH